MRNHKNLRCFYTIFCLLLALCFSKNTSAQSTPSNCVNVGFESGNFTNWTTFGTPVQTVASGTDQYGGFPKVLSNGGDTRSALIGDDRGHGVTQRLERTFSVSPNDNVYTFSFAIVRSVSEDPAENISNFTFSVVDVNGQPLSFCNLYSLVPNHPANTPPEGFIETGINGIDGGTVEYRPWISIPVDVSAYRGSSIKVILQTSDCATGGGHFAYAYFDAKCSAIPLRTTGTFTCSGNPVTIYVPEGSINGVWSGPGVNGLMTTSVQATQAGVYKVKYEIPGFTTGGSNCTFESSVEIKQPTLNISAGPDRSVFRCGSATIGSSPIAGVSYSWSPATGLANPFASSTTANPAVTTTYTLTGVLGVCTYTDVMVVNVLPAVPGLSYAGIDKTINCGNSTTIGQNPILGASYQWSPGTGLSSTTVSNPTANPRTSQVYTLTITQNGCKMVDAVNVTVNPSHFLGTYSNVTVTCGSSATIGAPAIPNVSYLWSPASTLNNPAVANPVANPMQSTTYSVTATSPNGCTDIASMVVNVTSPGFSAGVDQTVCPNTFVTLSADPGGITYDWYEVMGTLEFPRGSGKDIILLVQSQTKVYRVYAQLPSGCIVSDDVVINILPQPTVDAGPDKIFCEGQTTPVVLDAVCNPNYSYNWYSFPGSAINDPTICNPSVLPTVTTFFTLEVTDQNGCKGQDIMKLDFIPAPHVDAGNFQLLCNNSAQLALTYYTSSNPSFTWTAANASFPYYLNATDIENPVASPPSHTLYTARVTDMYGCYAEDTVSVLVIPFDKVNPRIVSGTTETWDLPAYNIKGLVIVEPGANLIIKNTKLTFTYGDANDFYLKGLGQYAKIQIAPGGIVDISNSYLEGSICGSKPDQWDGIEITHSRLEPVIEAQAKLTVNNSTITEAHTAISYQPQPEFTGSRLRAELPAPVTATSTTFINNERCIYALGKPAFAYRLWGTVLPSGSDFSASSFDNCHFAFDENLNFNSRILVELFKSEGMNFTKNLFYYKDTVPATQLIHSGFGFSCIGSSVKLGDGSATNENAFLNLNEAFTYFPAGQGIFSYTPSQLLKNRFINCFHAVTFISSSNDIIKDNFFLVNKGVGCGAPNPADCLTFGFYGIGMYSSRGFSIEENWITIDANLQSGYYKHGMVFSNTTLAGNVVYKNHHQGSECAVHTTGDNSNLKLRCNFYGEDGKAHKNGAWYLQDGQLAQQGKDNNCLANPENAAGNTFMSSNPADHDNCVSLASSGIDHLDINVEQSPNGLPSVEFKYYANFRDLGTFESTLPKCSPTYWYNLTYVSTYCDEASINSCSDKTAGIVVDPGSNLPENCGTYIEKLRTALNGKILEAEALEKTLALAGGTIGGNVASLKERIDLLRKEALQLMDELIRSYSICKELGAAIPSLNIYLKALPFAEAKRVLISRQLAEGNILEARITLDVLKTLNATFVWYNTAEKALQEADTKQFIRYAEVLIGLLSSGRSALVPLGPGRFATEMQSSELAIIRSIAQSKTATALQAQSILNLLYTEPLNLPLVAHKDNTSARKASPEGSALEDGLKKLYPQPNDGHFTLVHPSGKDLILEIYTVSGACVRQITIAAHETESSIDVSELPAGIYSFLLRNTTSVIQRDKLVIVK